MATRLKLFFAVTLLTACLIYFCTSFAQGTVIVASWSQNVREVVALTTPIISLLVGGFAAAIHYELS